MTASLIFDGFSPQQNEVSATSFDVVLSAINVVPLSNEILEASRFWPKKITKAIPVSQRIRQNNTTCM